jgi:hypothetical protein
VTAQDSHAAKVLRFWHACHHCDGRGCEVCEETKGWWSVDALDYDAVRDALVSLLDAVEDYGLDAAFGDEKFEAVIAARQAVRRG